MNLFEIVAITLQNKSLAEIFATIKVQGYLVLFLLMCIEGPIVTLVAAFAASLGIFNIYYVVILSLLGNTLPDLLYYLIGKWGRHKSVRRLLTILGIKSRWINKLRKSIKAHYIKTIILLKTAKFIPIPAIIVLGYLKLSFKRFFWTSLIFNIVATAIMAAAGYYSGVAINNVFNYLNYIWAIIIAIVTLVIIWAIIRSSFRKLLSKFLGAGISKPK